MTTQTDIGWTGDPTRCDGAALPPGLFQRPSPDSDPLPVGQWTRSRRRPDDDDRYQCGDCGVLALAALLVALLAAVFLVAT